MQSSFLPLRYALPFNKDATQIELKSSQITDLPFQMDETNKSLETDLGVAIEKIKIFNCFDFSKLNSFVNPYGFCVDYIRRVIPDLEMCTNSWCKMYEILFHFQQQFFTSQQHQLETLHLGEGPGSFICCFNHFLKTKLSQIQKWNWKAITLHPSHAQHILRENYDPNCKYMFHDTRLMDTKLDCFDFGKDNTGNLMNPENIEYYCAKYANQMDLITADAGHSFLDSIREQEMNHLVLLFCQIIVAFHCLKSGGHFVVKLFSFFESQTISVLHILYQHFEKLEFFKPLVSKQGNTEVYLICTNFKTTQRETMLQFWKECLQLCRFEQKEGKLKLFRKLFVPKEMLVKDVTFCKAIAQSQLCFAKPMLEYLKKVTKQFDEGLHREERGVIVESKIQVAKRYKDILGIDALKNTRDRVVQLFYLNGSYFQNLLQYDSRVLVKELMQKQSGENQERDPKRRKLD